MNEKVIIAGSVAAVVLFLFFKDQAARGLQAAGDALNPASPDNLAYSGVNAIGAAVSGQESFSFGSWLYDVFHPNEGADAGLYQFRPRQQEVRKEASFFEGLLQ